MDNFISFIKSLSNAHFTGPVSQGLIIKSECSLGIKFSSEYTEFLRNFGNMLYNHNEILGLNADHLDDCVSWTLEAREEDETIPDNLYVISSAGIDGILYLQGTDGVVYQHIPFAECTKVADSLEGFIKSFQ